MIRSVPPTNTGSDRHRSTEEIIFAILAIADKDIEGATKMQIMAEVFISYETATGYLEKLKREGLIDYNQGRGTYVTTLAGRKMMNTKNDNPILHGRMPDV